MLDLFQHVELNWGFAPNKKIIIANASNNIPYVWHSIKLFACIECKCKFFIYNTQHKHHSSSVRWILLLSSFFRWGKRDAVILCNLKSHIWQTLEAVLESKWGSSRFHVFSHHAKSLLKDSIWRNNNLGRNHWEI